MKKILFVDDEIRILEGLKRMLRGQRREWEMTFVDSGLAALDALAASRFDVVVTDMRMPRMDGAELLSVVQNVETPTMVITGEADYRTPMSESEQYYTALKLLKVDAVLVRAPGESHGIRSRPSHHIAKIENIAGWFERYRKKS